MNVARSDVMRTLNERERALVLFDRSEWEASLTAIDSALEQAPRDTELHNYRARALQALGRSEDALEAIENALAIDPENVLDLKNRATLLCNLGRPREWLESLDRILAKVPADFEVQIRRVFALLENERRHEALDLAEACVRRLPNSLSALNARGVALERLERYSEALQDFESILDISSNDVDAINNCGMIHARLGRWREALRCYDRSLTISAEQPQARYNRAIVLLSLDRREEGLREFEVRWQTSPLKRARPNLNTKEWNGLEGIRGKTLYVFHEQGFGDAIQCARYIAALQSAGASVILAVPPGLIRLFGTLSEGVRVVSLQDAAPQHDFHIPIMSLIAALEVSAGSHPCGRYLRADPVLVSKWAEKLGSRKGPRIGVAWRGRQYSPINYPRDIALEVFQKIFSCDADFISLQIEESPEEVELCRRIQNLDIRSKESIKDFADTAALIECLDLVICVDSAIAHLAGALGQSVWLLNRFASCWRWAQTGTASPLYRSMRVFRQSEPRDWESVVQSANAALSMILVEARDREARRVRRPLSLSGNEGKREPIRFVCATRLSAEEFLQHSALGRSLRLYQTFPKGQRIELRLFPSNVLGLPSVYNQAIAEAASDPAILIFAHDDVHLSDYFWADSVVAGLAEFDVVGIAGNTRRVNQQASWMYLNDRFERDDDRNLSGLIGHGTGFPELRQLSIYGDPRQECKLLDGVFLAVRSRVLAERNVTFDPRFNFHFYDLDFCRQSERAGLRLGTWPISIIHESIGKLGSDQWAQAYRDYLAKYGEL